jgi:hypothetical protein
MDGYITDKIHHFAVWYNQRLKDLPSLGVYVQTLYRDIFFYPLPGAPKSPLIYVVEDQETWRAKKGEYGFWIDTNGDGQPELPLRSEPWVDPSDYHRYPEGAAGVVYQQDIFFTDWLEYRFIPLVKKLDLYGYGPYEKGKNLNDLLRDINLLIKDVKSFEKAIASLYGQPLDGQIAAFDEWITLFYNNDPTKQDWYKRMVADGDLHSWVKLTTGWRAKLSKRIDEIGQCVRDCSAPGPYQCGNISSSDVCGRSWVNASGCCDDLTGVNVCCGSCSSCPPGTGYCGCGYCTNVSWCGCNPTGMDGGRLCNSPSPSSPPLPAGHCTPTHECTTPFGDQTPCCHISADGLYYQICDPTLNDSGGSGGSCPANKCQDTYYDCVVDLKNNVISREHANEYLVQFKDDVVALAQAFKDAYDHAEAAKADLRFYSALYEWKDRTGRKGEVTAQDVHHIAYVKLSDNLKPPFKIPYIHQYRDWFPPSLCSEVLADKGSFEITVARYDSDVGTSTSPLGKLWIFKTRKNPAQTEPGFQATPAFVLANGIVSKTRGHYGPGKTYNKNVIKNWGTKAAQRNRDIKIEKLNPYQ